MAASSTSFSVTLSLRLATLRSSKSSRSTVSVVQPQAGNSKTVDIAAPRLGQEGEEDRGLQWRWQLLRGKQLGRASSDREFARSNSQQLKQATVVARLFDPERFDPSKLTVRYENGANVVKGKSFEDLLPRKYTLTHSDITGELLLSVGPSFNRLQLADWYTRLMRDEIVAEWRVNGQISLHVYCHVSGGHILLAPAALRNSIFEREMPLVLEALRHGDSELLGEHPELHASTVWVHFRSSNPEYDRADCWGPLFYAASPMSRMSRNPASSNLTVPFPPYTLLEVQSDPVEQCTLISP